MEKGVVERKNIGLFGLGTVGSRVAELLLKNPNKEYRTKFVLKKIFEKDASKFKKHNIPLCIRSLESKDILKDPDIDIIIELIGGLHPAKEIVLTALEEGKDVITANKRLISEEGRVIFKKVQDKGRKIGFKASLLGCYPLLESLSVALITGRKIQKISGILNGTTNYILCRMEKGKTFKEAIKEAQNEGYAEKDFSLDIEGMDTAHKLSILFNLVYGIPLKPDEFPVEGIKGISLEDIKFAGELGYKIRLLGTIFSFHKEYGVRVCPRLVPDNHIFASFEGVQNGIEVKDSNGAMMGYNGPGAGKYLAASAVMDDLANIVKGNMLLPLGNYEAKPFPKYRKDEFKYYLRFSVTDQTGVLSSISSILARYKISIASVIQKERQASAIVPIIMLTHKAKEDFMQKAVKEIDRLNVVRQKTTLIRLYE